LRIVNHLEFTPLVAGVVHAVDLGFADRMNKPFADIALTGTP
jgi:hypothetical protein